MSNMRGTPKPCRECIYVGVINGPNGNALYQTCEVTQQECQTAVVDCHIAGKYEKVVLDYPRLLAFDRLKRRVQ
jgi:hypothetical protein